MVYKPDWNESLKPKYHRMQYVVEIAVFQVLHFAFILSRLETRSVFTTASGLPVLTANRTLHSVLTHLLLVR